MLNERLEKHYGENCQILTVRRPNGASGSLFVVDAPHHSRVLRTLGSIGRNGAVLEWSAMDLLHPERLVYAYERLMLLAFALVEQPASALLLGLGGGAMVRHLQAYVPDCALTIVERDAEIITLAQRYFCIAQDVVAADAEDVVADTGARFDVILIDLYDIQGKVPVESRFWKNCIRALNPGGCIAINWAGFLTSREVEDEIAAITPGFEQSFFVAERGRRPNMVQFAPTAPAIDPSDLEAYLRRFARERRLPREDRDTLQRCDTLVRYPPPKPKRRG